MENSLKEFKKDQNFLKKFKNKYTISGCYYMGEVCDLVEFKLIKSRIFFNWEILNMRMEIFKEERDILLNAYSRWMWIGEWGYKFEKPLIFMELITEEFTCKFKKILSVKDIFKLTNKSNIFNLNIYFEPIIEEDPKSLSYKKNNNIWISYVGGLYDIIDSDFWLETIEDGKLGIIERGTITKTKIINFKNLCDETANTAIDMRKNIKCKWKLFASNHIKHLTIDEEI